MMEEKSNTAKEFSWVYTPNQIGVIRFTFDGNKVFNLFKDYPYALSKEEKAMFDDANPFWADYFSDRSKEE